MVEVAGNTPTGVGKRPLLARRFPNCRKHPHGRGEESTLKFQTI